MKYPLFDFANVEIEPRWTAEDAERQAEALRQQYAEGAAQFRASVAALVESKTMQRWDAYVEGETDQAYLYAYWDAKLERVRMGIIV